MLGLAYGKLSLFAVMGDGVFPIQVFCNDVVQLNRLKVSCVLPDKLCSPTVGVGENLSWIVHLRKGGRIF